MTIDRVKTFRTIARFAFFGALFGPITSAVVDGTGQLLSIRFDILSSIVALNFVLEALLSLMERLEERAEKSRKFMENHIEWRTSVEQRLLELSLCFDEEERELMELHGLADEEEKEDET